MHPLLNRLLRKRKIEDVTELKEDEKVTFDTWERILSEGEITVDKIVEFCLSQINVIEIQWKNLDNPEKKNERLILMHTIYKTLVNLIKAPRTEKENLEKYLNDLLKK